MIVKYIDYIKFQEEYLSKPNSDTEEEKEGNIQDLNMFKRKLDQWLVKKKELGEQHKNHAVRKGWKDILESAIDGAKAKNSAMCFWNLTRLMALSLSPNRNKANIYAATKWNWLLRQCGYSGFADKTGKGYIHPSEPMQAVFLTTHAFTIVKKVDNKDHNNTDQRLEIENMERFWKKLPIKFFNESEDEGEYWTIDILKWLLGKSKFPSYLKRDLVITKTPQQMWHTTNRQKVNELIDEYEFVFKKYQSKELDELVNECRSYL